MDSDSDSENLPQRWDDPSPLNHEPLLSYCLMMKDALRKDTRQVFSSFVSAMQENQHAVKVAKKWILLMFGVNDRSHEDVKVLDDGRELYKAFFEFYLRVRGSEDGKIREYQVQVTKKGFHGLKIRILAPRVLLCSTQTTSGPGRIAPAVVATGSSLRPGHVATDTPIQGHDCLGSVSSPTAVADDESIGRKQPKSKSQCKPPHTRPSKKRKRNAQQQSPVISPSCAFQTLQSTPAEVVSHSPPPSCRPRRLASNPARQRALVLDLNAYERDFLFQSQGDASVPAGTVNKFRSNAPQPPQAASAPGAEFRFEQCGIRLMHPHPPDPVGRGGDKLTQYYRKVDNTHSPKAGSVKRGRAKARRRTSNDLPTRSCKRPRDASMEGHGNGEQRIDDGMENGPPFGEDGNGSAAGRADFPFTSPPIPPAVEGTSLIQPTCVPTDQSRSGSIAHIPSKVNLRRIDKSLKRCRVELETASAPQMADVREAQSPVVGTRELRPLPRKTSAKRALSKVTDEAISVRPRRWTAGSQEDVDRSVKDAATNALVVLRDGDRSTIPDWTRDEEQDNLPAADPCDVRAEAVDVQNPVEEVAQVNIAFKPRLQAAPPIWAQSRQEVCESLEHFRSYHGGVYSHKEVVKGYLLGAYAASRDVFHEGGKFIISHGGGRAESLLESRDGIRLQPAQDQDATDKSVRALLKNYKERRPLVLLADDNYAHFPYDLAASGYTYVVLGVYWISYAWAEYQPAPRDQGRIVRWKFAFQWCDAQDDPWWLSQREERNPSAESTDSPSELPEKRCGQVSAMEQPPHPIRNLSVQCKCCLETSAIVYTQGWMCLNPRCSQFWRIGGEEPRQLDYLEEFLKLVPNKFENLPSLLPPKTVPSPDLVTTTYPFSKGWHCAGCGRLSSRFKWEHWECVNCHARHVVEGRVRLAKEFWHQRPPGEFLHSRIGKYSGILACRPEPIDLGSTKGFTNRLTFLLPHGRGKIHLILGTPLANVDANTTFQQYQQQAITSELQLRRYPLRNHKLRGPLLANYFSQNSGEPYQYVGGTGNTVPFEDAPDCVRRALALIKERSGLAMARDIPFNEILSAAYMERQKMSFHSDSEKGLGPVVASLSLGSAAVMHFRPHVSGQKHKNMSQNALTLILRHGDVLIMEGDGVQKYYEHTVIPMNFRIAATARCIGST